jgi:hypothetical protein
VHVAGGGQHGRRRRCAFAVAQFLGAGGDRLHAAGAHAACTSLCRIADDTSVLPISVSVPVTKQAKRGGSRWLRWRSAIAAASVGGAAGVHCDDGIV